MSITRRQHSYYDVYRHPDDSILLAYVRGQKLENRQGIIQHIEHEKCPVCFQKLNDLGQVTHVLDRLGDMRSYQYYPILTLADIYAHVESPAQHRFPLKTGTRAIQHKQRPRRSAVRLVSVPVAFGLAILFTMVMLVFANLSARTLKPASHVGGTSSGQGMLTVVVPPHSIPAQHANVTATAAVTPARTAPATATQPHIQVCSTAGDSAQLQLVICGFGFDSAHKAMLFFYVPGKVAFWLPGIPIDNSGTFHVQWNVVDCGNMPIFIYGYEATGSKPIIVKLRITSFGACVASTSPVVKPSWLSPNFGL